MFFVYYRIKINSSKRDLYFKKLMKYIIGTKMFKYEFLISLNYLFIYIFNKDLTFLILKNYCHLILKTVINIFYEFILFNHKHLTAY